MKYYTVESHYEKEAPFGIEWKVELFDGHTLLEEYDHIFYNEIAGYCKCLEDIGYEEIRNYDGVEWLIDKCKKTFTDEDISIIESWFELTGCWPTE
jgi:hypothetical protein|nr:MAG TPA: hypothetical protein [Bacteriophage sp.]